jgi:hypothetical protein
VRKISRYAGQEFHLMPESSAQLLIPVTGQFHFMTEPTLLDHQCGSGIK